MATARFAPLARTAPLAVAALVLVGGGEAKAIPYQFSGWGTVDRVEEGWVGAAPSDLSGTNVTFAFSYIFDSETLDNQVAPDVASYWHDTGFYGMSAAVTSGNGSYSFATVPGQLGAFGVHVVNDLPESGHFEDHYAVVSHNNTGTHNGGALDSVYSVPDMGINLWRLANVPGVVDVFESEALLLSAPDVNDYPLKNQFFIHVNANVNGNNVTAYTILGTIQGMTGGPLSVAPEPSLLGLLAATGFLGRLGLRRRD